MEGGNAEKDEAGNALWDNDLEARNCFASFLAGGVGIDGWMFGVDGDESDSIPICCSIGKAMAAGCPVGTYVSSAVAGTDRAVGSSPMLIPVEAMSAGATLTRPSTRQLQFRLFVGRLSGDGCSREDVEVDSLC